MTFPPKHLEWPSAPPLPPQRPGMPSRMLHSFTASAHKVSSRIRPKAPPVVPLKLRISAPMPLADEAATPGAAAQGKGTDGMPPLLQSFALAEQHNLVGGSSSLDTLARQRSQARFVRWSSSDKVHATAAAARPPMPSRSASLGASFASSTRGGRRRRASSAAAIRAAAAAATAVRPRPGMARTPTSDAGDAAKPLIDLSGSGWYCADPESDMHAERVREAAAQAREAREARREARRIASLADPASQAPELPEKDRQHILARGPQSAADAQAREDWWAE